VVLLRKDLQGKGPAYVFADAGVETRLTAQRPSPRLSRIIMSKNIPQTG